MIRKQNLNDETNTICSHPVLLCECCGAIYSANREDYWQETEDHVFRCHGEKCKGRPMVLAAKEIQSYKVVRR